MCGKPDDSETGVDAITHAGEYDYRFTDVAPSPNTDAPMNPSAR